MADTEITLPKPTRDAAADRFERIFQTARKVDGVKSAKPLTPSSFVLDFGSEPLVRVDLARHKGPRPKAAATSAPAAKPK